MQSIEQTLQYMRDNARAYAKAKAARVHLEEFRKSKKALLINQAEKEGRKTGQEREMFAYAHPEYLELLDGLKEAIEEEARLHQLMTAARLRVEVWRTEQANNRKERDGYNA